MPIRIAIVCIGICWLFSRGVDTVKASDFFGPESVVGLRLQMDSTGVVLIWPSDPRESFVVLGRSNSTIETPWLVLTNQIHASTNFTRTIFHDLTALSRLTAVDAKTNLADLFYVFVIPDFWFDPKGITFHGGLENPGEDFLPFYRGNGATDIFKPEIVLLVDGEDFGAEENIERVNFGTEKKPRWRYSTGAWFQHDLLANGEHTLQLQTLLRLNNFVGDWSWTVTVTNAPVHVWVTNEINFAGFEPLIMGSNYTFIAQSAKPQVNWRMDVRDFRGHLLTSQTGRTTNGNIRMKWDLRDTEGRLHDTLDDDPYFLPTITTWPLDESEGSQRKNENRRKQPANSWWNQRLGQRFVRKEPSREERLRKAIYSEIDPLESQLSWRPYDNRNTKRSSAISP